MIFPYGVTTENFPHDLLPVLSKESRGMNLSAIAQTFKIKLKKSKGIAT